jgi:DDE superfamily endonuclease
VVAAHPGKKIHVVVDNATVHTSAETAQWLDKQKSNVVFHFTPTGASWVNQIEIWNGVITRKVIRRGTHSSVKLLIKDIELFVVNWNSDCVPIKWTATADEIIDNVRSITSHIERLGRASEIDDVIRQAA